jgi:hypothetical protein
LPDKAETARSNAESEFDALGVMEKAKFTMAFAYNVKMLSKLPRYIKQSVAKFKEDLNALKAAIEELKLMWPQFMAHGKTCSDASASTPVPCYKLIFGPIKYTQEVRTEWEEKMEEILWEKFEQKFNPEDYPPVDMIKEPEPGTEGAAETKKEGATGGETK